MLRRGAILLLIAMQRAMVAKTRPWKDGQLLSVEMKDFVTGVNRNHITHRYICTVGDGEFNYVAEYDKPLKVAVHDRLKFFIEKDDLIILDADGKERSARIEKRERAS
jgi:hypothetical protein